MNGANFERVKDTVFPSDNSGRDTAPLSNFTRDVGGTSSRCLMPPMGPDSRGDSSPVWFGRGVVLSDCSTFTEGAGVSDVVDDAGPRSAPCQWAGKPYYASTKNKY